jgi:hypothetical protein
VFEIKVDNEERIVEFVLAGVVHLAEMTSFVGELQTATLSLGGQDIRIKADLRSLRPASPEVANMIREVQAFGIRSGVKRVAEIVESDIVALQLNRVAKESGTDRILRRFWDDDSAREWLLQADDPEPAPASTHNPSTPPRSKGKL